MIPLPHVVRNHSSHLEIIKNRKDEITMLIKILQDVH